MTVTIHVTAVDIECGVVGSSQWCPVARAMSIALNRPVSVSGLGYWKFIGSRSEAKHRLPVEVNTWIDHFDGEARVKPFSFDIEAPQ